MIGMMSTMNNIQAKEKDARELAGRSLADLRTVRRALEFGLTSVRGRLLRERIAEAANELQIAIPQTENK